MVGSPLTATTAAQMTDTSKIYVYTGNQSGYVNGNWYYYNGAKWVSGGVYNAVAVATDATLSIPGDAADAAAVGEELANLKSALTVSTDTEIIPLINGGYINTSVSTAVNLTPISSASLSYAIVNCSEGDRFTITGTGAQSGRLWAFLDNNNYVLNRADASAEANELLIIAPENTAKLVINTYSGILLKGIAEKYSNYLRDNETLIFDKAECIAQFYSARGNAIKYCKEYIGDTYTSHFATLPNAYILKVPCSGMKSIAYPTFISSVSFGSVFIDSDDKIISGYVETSIAGNKTLNVPTTAEYFCITITSSVASTEYTITITKKPYALKEYVDHEIDLIKGIIVEKSEAANPPNTIINQNYVYRSDGLVIGTTTLSEVQSFRNNGGYSIKIPVTGMKRISYPMFKTSSNGMSFICNANDVVIWAHSESVFDTNTHNDIELPEGSVWFILTISAGLNSYDWSYTISSLNIPSGRDSGETTPFINENKNETTPFINENKNLCLAGIKTDILTNKIPYHRGFLFHKLRNDDNTLWYGNDFTKITRIGQVSYTPSLMRFAISPKDGRIIAVQRDTRNGIWVWDGTTETHLTDFETKPQAWLYNSGVDFINDGTDEYCVFAEYSGTVSAGTVLNVWRGKYPYTSVDDWEIVLSKTQSTDITHFHMVRRDPWTNILYLTAGDSSAESKWWYSTDLGETWTLLVSGTDTGWGNSLCRTINFIFTADYIYWATDHGEASAEHHTLNRIARDEQTSVFDLSTKEQLTLLPKLYATNSLCYVESPNGLFMYDRIDTHSSSVFGEPIKMMFWDFATETLYEIVSLKLTSSTWGGSRGKCYINYTNGKQTMPAMGFSIDTPCIFDLVCDNPSNIGTIAYDIGSKTIHTIDY